MSGKHTRAKIMLLGLSVGLIPCVAAAVDMPANPSSEQVDATHLGEVQEGVTARMEAGWTVQVGAYADKDKAEAQLEKLASDRPGELRHAARLVTALRWDDAHTLYRARFGGLTLEAASALCASLNGVGQACFLSQGDKADSKPYLREAIVVTDDMRGTGLGAPAASNAALQEALAAIPELSPVAEGPTASKAIAPKLVALNDKLANDKSGQVSNAELSGMRGGFFTAGGAQFDFGASIKTLVNGQLALQTNLTWTPQGPNISSLSGLGQQIANQVQSNLAQAGIGTGNAGNASNPAANTPASLNSLGSAASKAASNPGSAASNIATPATNLATGAVSSALNSAANALSNNPATNTAPTPAAAPQTTITVPTVMTGVTIPGAGGGSTQVLNNIGANQIQNIILNSASGQTINQNTSVTLTIYNLPQWQQQLAQHTLSAQLAGEVMAASGLGR